MLYSSHVVFMLLSVSDKPPPLDLPWFPCVNKESCVCVLSHFSCVQLCVMLWTVACQAPLSMGFSTQEHWNGLPCPPPGDLVNLGIEPASLMSLALARGFFTPTPPKESQGLLISKVPPKGSSHGSGAGL